MEEKPPAPTSTTKDQRRLSQSRYLKLDRLPTLQEVLDRRTRPPLDLFCFYIFLQRESSEDALDFWLDVQQHENMCKAYFKDLRKSGRSVEEDWPEFAFYARTNGSHFSPLLSLAFQSHQDAPPTPARVSSEAVPRSPEEEPTSPMMRERRDTESHGPGTTRNVSTPNSPALGSGSLGKNGMGMPIPGGNRMSIRGKFGERRSKAPTVIARDRAIEKAALVDGAERIYLRYLLPGGEREIYLPPSLRIDNFPISTSNEASPLIPDLFHSQKIYIFKALEQDAFPRFLRAKAFGNLTPVGSFIRLVLGLFVLWGAFVLGFSLIFLNHKPRLTRLWIILPFIVAFNLLLSSYYSLSPLLALFSQSETTPFHLIHVREGYVRKLLSWRALWIELVCIVVTAVFTVIFTVVPGHRLKA
ncbi:hypothetical protein P7C73_g6220, partial [Tremellales sp. Uapishka_1]